MKGVTRFGIVGTGKRGLTYARALEAAAGAQLVSVSDLDSERASIVAGLVSADVEVVGSLEPLLDRCEALIIATPDDSHTEIALAALAAGRAVLCDKPAGITVDQVNALASALTARPSVPFDLAMVLRYHPFYQALAEVLHTRRTVTQVHVMDMMRGEFYFRRWHRLSKYTGGIVLHEGIHALDIIGWLLGTHPLRVTGSSFSSVLKPKPNAAQHCGDCAIAGCAHRFDVQTDPLAAIYRTPRLQEGEARDLCVFNSTRDVEETHSLLFDYTGDVAVSYSLTLVAPIRTRRYTFVCDDVVVDADEATSTITLSGPDGTHTRRAEVPAGEFGGADRRQLEHFASMVRAGRRDDSVLAQNLAANVTGIAAERSMRDGRPVTVDSDMATGYRLSVE
ncbi:Gfo/Idh/MocA family protein [Streptomyces sp. cmx-4-7]|uniref:Gfo/Idh/MocA family protein n=1 Tax=Streptomyces sp. cmx-4-7 TaxID=2790939 RepID=UPI0039804126